MFFVNWRKYGPLNTHDIIKAVAITAMMLDHVGKFFFPELLELRIIGRVAFPLFLFLVGWSLQYRFKKDLLFYAIALLAIDVALGSRVFPLDILFTIIIARFLLKIFERWRLLDKKYLPVLFALMVAWWPLTYMAFDYGSSAFTFAICGYFAGKNEKSWQFSLFFFATIIFFFATQWFTFDFSRAQLTVLAVLFALLCWWLYNLKMKKYEFSNNIIVVPILFVARNSLQLYFLHLTLIKLTIYLAN